MIAFILLPPAAYAYTLGLEWDPTDQPTVTTTRIYVQAGPEAPFVSTQDVPQPTTKATLTGLADEVQYGFYATYLDSNGLESDPSEKVYWLTLPYLRLKPGVGLAISGTAGKRYQIEKSEDLKTWTILTVIDAPSDRFSVPVDFTQPKMFFRVGRLL